MSDATFTFRVDEELKAAFVNAAKEWDRTGAQLLRDYMRDVVAKSAAGEHDAWFRDQVAAGIASADVGRVDEAAAVEEEFAKRRAETLRKLKSRP